MTQALLYPLTVSDLLERYDRGERDFSNATVHASAFDDLSRVDLRGVNLTWGQLDGLDLSGTDFRGATLHGTMFRDSTVEGADFRGADMEKAVLISAHAEEANFRRAILTQADFYKAKLSGAMFQGSVALSEMSLDKAEDMDLAGMIMDRSAAGSALGDGADIHGVVIKTVEYLLAQGIISERPEPRGFPLNRLGRRGYW